MRSSTVRWSCLALLLGGGLAVPARGVTAGVWVEPSLADEAACPPETLRALLAGERVGVEELSTADLLDPARLAPARLRFLVLPYGAAYPAAGHAAIERYLTAGGSLLTFGGPSFQRPLVQVGAVWLPWDRFGETVWQAEPAGTATIHGPQDEVEVAWADGVCRATITALHGWAYAALTLPALPADAGGLVLEARGDASTPRLALELGEQDGSRWKAVVPLGETWREVRLPTAAFVSYASESRAGPDDGFHPAAARLLSCGVTKALVGDGAHTIELRAVTLRRAAVAPELVPAKLVPAEVTAAARRYFGEPGTPGLLSWPSCFAESERIETGAGGAWTVTGPGAPPQPRGWSGHVSLDNGVRTWSLQPLARDAGQVTAALVSWYAGPRAGSLVASFGWDRLPAGREPTVRRALLALAAAPAVGPLEVVPVIEELQARLAARRTVIHRGNTPVPVVHGVTGGRELTVSVDPRRPEPMQVEVGPVGGLAGLAAARTIETTLAVGDGWRETATVAVDPRGTLRALADFLADEAADDGKMSGISFVDHRGVRTLLGAWRIFGEERFREAARGWGRAMLAEQRDDGGYRMGYGITAKGEECYVADGGEIALGIASLAAASEGAERQALLASLGRYLAYRESFRVPTGGIGVGWCLSDYGQRPVVPLPAPTKVFAPEQNTYTIGCTLAAAYAAAALFGDAGQFARADGDADWLMPRSQTLHGASCESFFWAHALTTDPARRATYAAYFAEHFTRPLTGRDDAWWLLGGGRSALNLDGLVYAAEVLDGGPPVEAELARAVWALCEPSSPTSFHRLIGRSGLTQNDWIYLCFGGVGLADLVQPGVTLRGIRPPGL